MFTHIVLWTLQESAGGRTRAENARLVKERLEEIANMLDGVRRFEVGINEISGSDAADVALFSEFESREALQGYIDHPAHQAAAGFIDEVRVDRRVIDYSV